MRLENEDLRVTVTVEGGHIAELLHKATGANPLWIPPWPSLEPSDYQATPHPEYGDNAESQLLAGILGHNLCLDIFGGPSEEEAAAGLTVHGEASVVPYDVSVANGVLTQRAVFPHAQLRFARIISFTSRTGIGIAEEVENLSAHDRPIAWTQHVTLGPPFLERGLTQLRVSATRSKVIEYDFAECKGYMKIGAEFEWPYAPRLNGGTVDLRTYVDLPISAAFTTHLMDPKRSEAFFLAWSPKSKVLIGYVWNSSDFPWLGIWEENHRRTAPPWNGQALTCGMEFGVSPLPETRRQMIERGSLFGVPAYRWIPARKTLRVQYRAFITVADAIPESPPLGTD